MELFQILTGLAEGQNAESIEHLQKQVNLHAHTINGLARLNMQTNLELLLIVIAVVLLAVILFLWLYSITQKVKRLEKVLANVTAKTGQLSPAKS